MTKQPLRYKIHTYGCQMNDNDSEKLAGILEANGYEKAQGADADLIAYNTCCVREHAELRVFGNIGALREVKEAHPELIIAVGGCMMQQQEVAQKLFKRYPFVDIIFGTHNLSDFPALLERAKKGERAFSVLESETDIQEGLPISREGSVSTSVPIMYGCDNFCSYCVVPYVRGRERSRTAEAIEAECAALVGQRYSEITLLGQNVNSYVSEDVTFAKLLRRLSAIEGLKRIRFMTSHPKDLSTELIDAMAELAPVCNHIHLPVQSGSDRILTEMNRAYTRSDYLSLVERLRAAVSGIELTTDVIVGFPGETDEDFALTLDLMKRIGFASAYTFAYSPRKGTPAAIMSDQVDKEIKKSRLHELNALQAALTRQNNEKYIGATLELLVEGFDDRKGLCYGKSGNFKMVYFPGEASKIGQYTTVLAKKIKGNSLFGEITEA